MGFAIPVLNYHSTNISGNEYATNDHVALRMDLTLLSDAGWTVRPLHRAGRDRRPRADGAGAQDGRVELRRRHGLRLSSISSTRPVACSEACATCSPTIAPPSARASRICMRRHSSSCRPPPARSSTARR